MLQLISLLAVRVPPAAVRSKLAMLAAPFLRRWSYVRVAEQISGGHKYLPPRQDVNAPGGSWPHHSHAHLPALPCLWLRTASSDHTAIIHSCVLRLPSRPADLYIPLMAIWTYCLLIGAAALARSGPSGGGFKPEIIYNSVRVRGRGDVSAVMVGVGRREIEFEVRCWVWELHQMEEVEGARQAAAVHQAHH